MRDSRCLEAALTEWCYVNWKEHRFTLVSLMALLHVNAESFCRVMAKMGQTVAYLEVPPHLASPTPEHWGSVGGTLGEIERELEKLELRFSLNQIAKIKGLLDRRSVSNSVMRTHLAELAERIVEELEGTLFLSVPVQQAQYYERKAPLFGEDVASQFPSLSEDIDEAGKCFALNRYTAAVFHLMRVMEAGLQEFGARLGVELVTDKNWQNILDEANKAIKGMQPKKDPLAKVYAEAAAHLYNVKVAWRNEVMHPRATYTDEEAKRLFENVKTFMSDLAQMI